MMPTRTAIADEAKAVAQHAANEIDNQGKLITASHRNVVALQASAQAMIALAILDLAAAIRTQ